MSGDDTQTCSTEKLIRGIGASLREDRRGYKNLRDMEQVTTLPRSWLSWVMGPKERGTDCARPTYKVWRLARKSAERILNADGISDKTKNLAEEYLAFTNANGKLHLANTITDSWSRRTTSAKRNSSGVR